jgi:thiamine pyrophosphokinase
VSNEFVGDMASITLASGTLIITRPEALENA